MSEKRFYYGIFDDGTEYIEDYKKKEYYFNLDDVEHKLNEQQVTIDKLDQENADILCARIKAQEEWEKCTDKLKVKILQLQEENEKLSEKNRRLIYHMNKEPKR